MGSEAKLQAAVDFGVVLSYKIVSGKSFASPLMRGEEGHGPIRPMDPPLVCGS